MNATIEELARFTHFAFEFDETRVLTVRFTRPEKLNALTREAHRQLSRIWTVINDLDEVGSVLVLGDERAFCAGGDFEMIEAQIGNFHQTAMQVDEAPDIVYGMVNCAKPIVSAIRGVAVGAGLAVALTADISIASTTVRLGDGHMRLGLVAGDHAVLLWPLLCGMAKSKYFLLTGDFMSGEEADRIGLVSRAVPDEEVEPLARRIAEGLAQAPDYAVRWTKRALAGWLHLAAPVYETSSALELLSFLGPHASGALANVRAGSKRDKSVRTKAANSGNEENDQNG